MYTGTAFLLYRLIALFDISCLFCLLCNLFLFPSSRAIAINRLAHHAVSHSIQHSSRHSLTVYLLLRFGEHLRSSIIQEYYWYYIAYDELKKALKTDFVQEPTPENTKPDRKAWSEDDEQRFVSLLENDLDKVFNFQRIKSEEIVRRIQASEKDVNDVISRLDSNRNQSGARRSSVRSVTRPPPSDEDFLFLEQVLSDIIADVHDLAKFTQLNYTGFQKIIKKHDVRLQPFRFPFALVFSFSFRVSAQLPSVR